MAFPSGDLLVLLDFFRNRTAHTVGEYAESAYSLLGFALGQVTGRASAVVAAQCPDEIPSALTAGCPSDCQVELEKLHTALCTTTTTEGGHTAAAVTAINWGQILSIVVSILQQLGPVLR